MNHHTTPAPITSGALTDAEILAIGQSVNAIEASHKGGYYLPFTFARAIEKHLASRATDAPAQGEQMPVAADKPVAWKYRVSTKANEWRFTESEEWARSINGDWEVIPLYAAPVAASAEPDVHPLADEHGCWGLYAESVLERAASADAAPAGAVADDGYGKTDFGFTFAGIHLEEGDKRLMSLLVEAFGTAHPVIDDMTALLFRVPRTASPAAAEVTPAPATAASSVPDGGAA